MNVLSLLTTKNAQNTLIPERLAPALDYIAAYWSLLLRRKSQDEGTLVGLPHPYLVPAHDELAPFNFNELYYWDSYFMVQSMLSQECRQFVAGILDDLITLYQRFGIIPNASRTYLTGRSQPPLLTSLIFDVYNIGGFDLEWLQSRLAVAESEYRHVWMNDKKPHWRRVYRGLSRYYDINMLHDLAEAESGWDMTSRFNRQCLNYLPVDLNSLLYKYETDFAKLAELVRRPDEAAKWRRRAEERRAAMHELMWDETRDFFYDYNFKKQRLGRVSSLAGYYTMWAGLASEQQAAKMVKTLRRFEHRGGLACTDRPLPALPIGMPVQWAYPNGWAPLHFIVVEGLRRYGYEAEARRIARKWLAVNLSWFEKYGVFLEKYNVVSPDKPPVSGLYPCQTGFGWTNAVFERFARDWL